MLPLRGLLGALWMAPRETGFCTCAVRTDVRTEFDVADAVFTGRVVDLRDPPSIPRPTADGTRGG